MAAACGADGWVPRAKRNGIEVKRATVRSCSINRGAAKDVSCTLRLCSTRDYHSLRSRILRASEETRESCPSPICAKVVFIASVTLWGD